MQPFAHLVKVSVPNYLQGLPIPDSIGGWFRLGFRDWLSLVPPSAVCVGVGYMAYKAFCPHGKPKQRINETHKLECPKIVHSFNIEDLGANTAFCRCWKSETFPLCDGSHGRHNEASKDNVGPLVMKRTD